LQPIRLEQRVIRVNNGRIERQTSTSQERKRKVHFLTAKFTNIQGGEYFNFDKLVQFAKDNLELEHREGRTSLYRVILHDCSPSRRKN
jgi:hypothetical protein